MKRMQFGKGAPKPKPLLESQIQRQILDYLKARGIFAWKASSTGIPIGTTGTFRKATVHGVPDILAVIQREYGFHDDGSRRCIGGLLAIEVKRPGKKPTAAQETFLRELQKRGAVAFVAYSLQDVIDRLEVPERPPAS